MKKNISVYDLNFTSNSLKGAFSFKVLRNQYTRTMNELEGYASELLEVLVELGDVVEVSRVDFSTYEIVYEDKHLGLIPKLIRISQDEFDHYKELLNKKELVLNKLQKATNILNKYCGDIELSQTSLCEDIVEAFEAAKLIKTTKNDGDVVIDKYNNLFIEMKSLFNETNIMKVENYLSGINSVYVS